MVSLVYRTIYATQASSKPYCITHSIVHISGTCLSNFNNRNIIWRNTCPVITSILSSINFKISIIGITTTDSVVSIKKIHEVWEAIWRGKGSWSLHLPCLTSIFSLNNMASALRAENCCIGSVSAYCEKIAHAKAFNTIVNNWICFPCGSSIGCSGIFQDLIRRVEAVISPSPYN